jgi:hypothetical protein
VTNYARAVRAVESLDFRIRLNVASGLTPLLLAFAEEPALVELVDALKDADVREGLVNHVADLAGKSVDPRYESDADIALAAFVWALATADRSVGQIAAQVACRAPQCWWAPKVSSAVLLGALWRLPERRATAQSEAAMSPIPPAISPFIAPSSTVTLVKTSERVKTTESLAGLLAGARLFRNAQQRPWLQASGPSPARDTEGHQAATTSAIVASAA